MSRDEEEDDPMLETDQLDELLETPSLPHAASRPCPVSQS